MSVLVAFIVDAGVLAGSFMAAYWLRFAVPIFPDRPMPSTELYLRFSIIAAVIGASALLSGGAYRDRPYTISADRVAVLARACLITTLFVILVGYLFRGVLTPSAIETSSRIIVTLFGVVAFTCLVAWRVVVAALLGAAYRKGYGLRRTLIVGASPMGCRFHRAIMHRPELGFDVIGFVSDTRPDGDEPVLGSLRELPEVLRREAVNEVVVALEQPGPDLMTRVMAQCRQAGVAFRQIPEVAMLMAVPAELNEVAGFPVITPRGQLLYGWNRLAKRLIDVLVATILGLLILPVGVALGILIRVTSPGPVLFSQERVGRDRKFFRMLKFRSMSDGAENHWRHLRQSQKCGPDPLLRIKDDPRVTWSGRFMRRFSLDELPQLLNVIRGDMSLVGPRPHVPEEVADYQEWQERRFEVLPGITGLTQVGGRKDLSLEDMTRLDIYYIENWSVWLDIKILFRTLPVVLGGRGAY